MGGDRLVWATLTLLGMQGTGISAAHALTLDAAHATTPPGLAPIFDIDTRPFPPKYIAGDVATAALARSDGAQVAYYMALPGGNVPSGWSDRRIPEYFSRRGDRRDHDAERDEREDREDDQPAPVPLPGGLWLLGSGVAVLGSRLRGRRKDFVASQRALSGVIR